MRRIAILAAAAVGSLIASNSFAALVVTQTRGTSPNAPGKEVVYYRVQNDSGPTVLQAQSFEFTVTGGTLFFGEDQDASGGVGTSASATSIASRSAPFGTFAFLPAATNVDVIPPGTGDFASGSTAFNAQSFRTASGFTAAAEGLIIAAAVVTPGTTVNVIGSVNSTLIEADATSFVLTSPGSNIPEPTTLAALGAAGLFLGRRRK